MKTKRGCLFAVMVMAYAPRAGAAAAATDESGFGGNLSVGSVFANTRTNMVSSAGFGLQLGEASIGSLSGGPRTHTGPLPLIALSLQYRFARTGTELFLSSGNGDALQYDGFVQGGVHQGIGSAGALSLAYLFSPPVKVWGDPYVTGVEREETIRRSQGARMGWESVLGSPLQLQYTFRHVAIDGEGSGTLLGLSRGDRMLLRRAGEMHRAEIRYPFRFARAHELAPALSYTREDLQGGAMSAHTYELELRYAFGARAFTALVEGSIGRSIHDRRNPIFGKTQADVRYGASATLLYWRPFGWSPFGDRPWSLFATVSYAAADSNVAFYSASVFAVGAGLSMKL